MNLSGTQRIPQIGGNQKTSPLCMILIVSRSYNLGNLSLKCKLNIPQIEGYLRKFPSLDVFEHNQILQSEEFEFEMKSPLPQIEGYQRNSLLCRFFLQWNPTIWEINSSISIKMTVIKILSNLKHLLQGITDKTLIIQAFSFCSFYHGSYPTIWGMWIWVEHKEFPRLEEIK